jgi:hypothetical protein
MAHAHVHVIPRGARVTFPTHRGKRWIIAEKAIYWSRRTLRGSRPGPRPGPRPSRGSLFAVLQDRRTDWLKTLRRMNGIVLLATQNLCDICRSDIGNVILEMCPHEDSAAEQRSGDPPSKEFYDRLGLNSRELDILQASIPRQH